jgi:enoyl-CoA hydratase
MENLSRLRVNIADHIAVVTMGIPPVNAQDRQFHEEMMLVFDRFSEMSEVRVAILTGAGKTFSAGADIKARAAVPWGPGERWQHARRARECFNAICECKKPVIAAINGPALGAGLALAASCDILVAADTASLGLPEIGLGRIGGAKHAMRLFGHSLARRMVLTGHRVSGAELYRLGVVEACVPPDELMAKAGEIARDIAAKSPLGIRLAKQALNTIEDLSLRDGFRFEQEMTTLLTGSEDTEEAVRAFLEKRAPVFRDR